MRNCKSFSARKSRRYSRFDITLLPEYYIHSCWSLRLLSFAYCITFGIAPGEMKPTVQEDIEDDLHAEEENKIINEVREQVVDIKGL